MRPCTSNSQFSLAEPLPAVVAPLIGKAHRNPVLPTTPDSLDQAVVELPLPYASEKRLDSFAALQKLDAVSPSTVWGIGDRKSTRLNSSHLGISYAVFCLDKK